jgi:hypothetical protein
MSLGIPFGFKRCYNILHVNLRLVFWSELVIVLVSSPKYVNEAHFVLYFCGFGIVCVGFLGLYFCVGGLSAVVGIHCSLASRL